MAATLNKVLSGIVGNKPGLWQMSTTDSLASILAPGYIPNAPDMSVQMAPTDVILGTYNTNPTFGIFTPIFSNNVITLNQAGGVYSVASGTLTLAQILLLYSNPVTIVPAPGVGLMNVVNLLVFEGIYGSAAFTSGGAIYLQYGTTAHGSNPATTSSQIPAAFLTGLSANTVISTTGNINGTTGLAATTVSNAAISITNATAVFATGTGCSVKWTLYYSVIPVT